MMHAVLPYEPAPPFKHWSGPIDAKLVIVGEAWGKNEDDMLKPFVGESGKELFLILGEAFPDVAPELHREIVDSFRYGMAWVNRRNAWLEAASIAFTNTLNFRPMSNDIKSVCVSKKELPHDYPMPELERALYLDPRYLPELDRLRTELEQCKPNLVVCAGGKASWALMHDTKISKVRGAVNYSMMLEGVKVLPTYHPAAVLRNWSWRPIVLSDLMKASREMQHSSIRRVSRKILYSPSIEEVEQWTADTLRDIPQFELAGVDTETVKGQIEMISIARTPFDCIAIPFVDESKPGWSYWATPELELRAWNCVARLLEHGGPRILWQNGLYDLQYVLPLGIRARSHEDSMLYHHSVLPEVQKGLGFLASIYCDEPAWKLMRTRKMDTVKRDE